MDWINQEAMPEGTDRNQIYALHYIIRTYSIVAHTMLSQQELNVHQMGMLFTLRFVKEGISQSELAHVLFVRPSSVASMLNTLEKQECIHREPDKQDKRINRVYLTETGKELANRVISQISLMSDGFFGNFTDEERSAFKYLSGKLQTNMMKILGEIKISEKKTIDGRE